MNNILFKLWSIGFVLIITIGSSVSFAKNVSGNIYLERQSDHAGVTILFTAVSPTAVTTSTVSKSNGSYESSIPAGVYDISWTKSGYTPRNITSVLIANDSVIANYTLENIVDAVFLEGFVAGTLYKDTFYLVDSLIEVSKGQSLYIEPGTEIKFAEEARFFVKGTLIARGTPTDKIVFRKRTNTDYWKGITILSDDPAMLISHCIFLDFVEGLSVRYTDNFTIEHCDFDKVRIGLNTQSCDGLIVRHCSFILGSWYEPYYIGIIVGQNSVIEHNYVKGFRIGINAWSPEIVQRNRIENCEIGIRNSSSVSSAEKYENNIINNCDIGMYIYADIGDAVMNNTIYNCDLGLHVEGSNNNIGMNCITHNQDGASVSANNIFTYNLVSKNSTNFISAPIGVGTVIDTNINGHNMDTYFNLINVPPVYYTKDFNHPHFLYLLKESPCIDAGDPNYKDPDGSIRDIGANPYVTWVGIDKAANELSNNLYPNPNSGHFNLNFSKLRKGYVKIIDVSGKAVYEEQFEMTDKLKFNLNLKPGIYLLQVNDDSEIKSTKFIVKE